MGAAIAVVLLVAAIAAAGAKDSSAGTTPAGPGPGPGDAVASGTHKGVQWEVVPDTEGEYGPGYWIWVLNKDGAPLDEGAEMTAAAAQSAAIRTIEDLYADAPTPPGPPLPPGAAAPTPQQVQALTTLGYEPIDGQPLGGTRMFQADWNRFIDWLYAANPNFIPTRPEYAIIVPAAGQWDEHTGLAVESAMRRFADAPTKGIFVDEVGRKVYSFAEMVESLPDPSTLPPPSVGFWDDVSQQPTGVEPSPSDQGVGEGAILYWDGRRYSLNKDQRLWNYEAARRYGMLLEDDGLFSEGFGTWLMVVSWIESRANPCTCYPQRKDCCVDTPERTNVARGLVGIRPETAWGKGLQKLDDWQIQAGFYMPWAVAFAAHNAYRLKKNRSKGVPVTMRSLRRAWGTPGKMNDQAFFEQVGGQGRWDNALDFFGIDSAFSDVVLDIPDSFPSQYDLASILGAPQPEAIV